MATYFKSINDILGHDEGDKVLVAFSNAIKQVIRDRLAMAARWGGDEFVIVGKEQGIEDNFRENMKKALEKNKELSFIPAFSYGVYKCVTPTMTIEQALQKVDEKLYQDKEIQHRNKDMFIQELRCVKQSLIR